MQLVYVCERPRCKLTVLFLLGILACQCTALTSTCFAVNQCYGAPDTAAVLSYNCGCTTLPYIYVISYTQLANLQYYATVVNVTGPIQIQADSNLQSLSGLEVRGVALTPIAHATYIGAGTARAVIDLMWQCVAGPVDD